MNEEDLNKIIKESLTDVCEGKFTFEDSTSIFGENSIIDSMALVNAILTIEEKIAEAIGIEIEIIDEEAIISDESPFQNVGKLTTHIFKKIVNF